MARNRIRPERAACKVCGQDFAPSNVRQVCCSVKCGNAYSNRNRSAKSLTRRSVVCQHCNQPFVAKGSDRLKFCSRECSFARKKEAALIRKEMGKHCAVHFPTCRHCSRAFSARQPKQVYCCIECRSEEMDAKRVARIVRVEQRCPECSIMFIPTHNGRLFCSDVCRNRSSRRVRRKGERAKQRAAFVEWVNPTKIFERDGWTCQMCGCSTPRKLRGTYLDNAPELDHVIPLARGGEHSYRNVQLLCRKCNLAKSATMPNLMVA